MGKTRFNRLTLALTKTTIIMLLGSFCEARVLGIKDGEKPFFPIKTEVTSSDKFVKEVSVCSNELPFYWNGTAYTASGEYAVQVKENDAISLFTLKLTVVPSAIWYPDTDGDGFGNGNNPTQFCTVPSGYVTNNLDCDDSDPSILQPREYFVDVDRDGYGSDVAVTLCSSVPPAGYSSVNTDCDDHNSAMHPNSVQRCRGINNELNASSVSAYPNPGKGLFKLSFRRVQGDVNLEVFNAQGLLVSEIKADALRSQDLNLESQPAGIYTVKCNSAGFQQTLLLIKQ